MTTRNPLVVISGVVQELPAGDSIVGASGGSSVINNVLSTPTTVATDTSMIVASYLDVESTLTVNGNLLIVG
jgi:hypothetical protein